MIEKWKPIQGYEGLYEVSNLGRVKSCDRYTDYGRHLKEKLIHGGECPNGYKFVCLRKNGRNKNYLVHRLVANEFVINPHFYPVVNHIDGNKENNNFYNLEWCTQSYNLEHAVNIGLMESQCKIRRKVVLRFEGNKEIRFNSMSDCAKFFGYKRGWLQNRLRKFGNDFEYSIYRIHVCERG